MSKFFRRSWKVQVANFDVSGLDIDFKILKNIKPEPNKASCIIYNLSETKRTELQLRNKPNPDVNKVFGIPVKIDAGYVDNISTIFFGDMRDVHSRLSNNDWLTTLNGDDGGRCYRESRVNFQAKKGAPVASILKQACTAMGIGLGNSAGFLKSQTIAGFNTSIPGPMTLSGAAADHMTRVCESIGLTWSIQDGALQLQRVGEAITMDRLDISPASGLVGSTEDCIDSSISMGNPQQFAPNSKQKTAKPAKPKDPGIIKFKTLITPGLLPGRQVRLTSSDHPKGADVFLTEIEYSGQSWSTEWFATCVGRVMKGGKTI